MTAFNRWVSNHIVKAAATENVEGERVGAINKAFSRLYEIHLLSRRIKEWNYRAYYALKFSLVAAVLAVVFVSAFT